MRLSMTALAIIRSNTTNQMSIALVILAELNKL